MNTSGLDDDEKPPIDLYFHSFSSENKKILPVGVGNNSIFDIDVDNYGNVEVQSRKSRKYENNEKYNVYIPSLPLDAPNKYKPIISKDFMTERFLPSHKEQKILIHEQYDRLKLSEFHLFHESIYELGGKRFYDEFLDGSTDDTQSKQKNWQTWQSYCGDDIADISKDIVEPLLGASILLEKENYEKNYHLKNCLAHYEKNGRTVIFCPTGPLMDNVAMKEIFIDNDQSDIKQSEFKMLKSVHLFKLDVGFLIKELICKHDMLYIRGEYSFHIYFIELIESESKLILNCEYNFEDIVHSIGVNMNFPLDVFVVFEDRALYHLLDGPEPQKIVYDQDMTTVRWQTCIYGPSRETCLVSNSKDVLMYDFRMKNTAPSVYLDISTCPYVDNKLVKLSPAMIWNPSHYHQYFVSTNYNILLNDERYLKTPVLQFDHYLDSPPYFMEMFLDSKGSDLSTTNDFNALLLTGAYRTADCVLNQMFTNGTVDISFGVEEKLKCNRPVTVSLPYRLSNYSNWKTYVSDWRFSLTPYKRLDLPSIGVTLCNIQGARNKNLIYFIQQSLGGDLFFQQMILKSYDIDISVNELMQENSSPFQTETLIEKNEEDVTLDKICKKRCQKWMDSIVKDDNDGDLFCEFESCHDTKEKNETCEKMDYLEDEKKNYFLLLEKNKSSDDHKSYIYDNPHDVSTKCLDNMIDVLTKCSEDINCLLESDSSEDIKCFCPRCSVKWSDKISMVRKDSNILTRKSLGLPEVEIPDEVNDMFKNIKYHDNRPLNLVLRAQWDGNDYVSLQDYAPNLEFDVEQYL